MSGNEEALRKRDEEIEKLVKITEIIVNELPVAKRDAITTNVAAGRIDLDISDEISGILMTIFTCMRKERNDATGHAKYKEYKATIDGVEVHIGTIVDKIKAQDPSIVPDFTISTPIVEIMTLFKAFFDEVRTGVTKFRVRENVLRRSVKRDATGKIIGRQDPKEFTQNISQYGLTNQHIPLLQGITLAPERRTGVIRSLGPLAQCLLLIMEDRYYEKLVNCVSQSLMMLPMNAEIASCLKDASTPGKTAGVLKELGDILLLTTSRSTQKMYFPLLATCFMWRYCKSNAFQWSFSGADMLKLYNYAVNEKNMKFVMKSGGTSEMLGEAVFHAIFGTYLEDLGVLAQITTKNTTWSTRREMNKVFLKRSSQPKKDVTMIKFKYISKMAQALLTKSMGNIEPCHITRPSFSGLRNRSFATEFLTYLRTGKGAQNYSSDPMQLQYALKKIKEQLMEDINDVKLIKAGTTKWLEESIEGWEETDFVAEDSGRSFFK